MARRPAAAPWVPLLLVALLLVVHVQLWVGRGSVRDVAQLQSRLAAQQRANDAARLDNERLAAEVRDLREGLETIEEKARLELGMVRPNEILVQYAR